MSDEQIHALYPEDIREGICRELCQRIADMPDQFGHKGDYADVVFKNHGVKPPMTQPSAKPKSWWRRLFHI